MAVPYPLMQHKYSEFFRRKTNCVDLELKQMTVYVCFLKVGTSKNRQSIRVIKKITCRLPQMIEFPKKISYRLDTYKTLEVKR